jgi:hypothetical protein
MSGFMTFRGATYTSVVRRMSALSTKFARNTETSKEGTIYVATGISVARMYGVAATVRSMIASGYTGIFLRKLSL